MTDIIVVKRDGRRQEVSFDKITARLKSLANGVLPDGTYIGKPLNLAITPLAQEVIGTLKNGMTTSELDTHAANICGTEYNIYNADYSCLGGRIAVSNLHKNTYSSLSQAFYQLREVVSPLMNFITEHFSSQLEPLIDYQRDYGLTYFGFKTLQKSYLLKNLEHNYCERPAHMYFRVACCITFLDRGGEESIDRFQENFTEEKEGQLVIKDKYLEYLRETYNLLSHGYYSHASPTMFNAGTKYPQLSSCFLLSISDSLSGTASITECWQSCAQISKRAGGIGIGMTPIRGSGSIIRGTGGKSKGIMPLLRIFNDIARYVNQGGRRKGSFSIYIEPWHPDIFDFLEMRKNHGKEELRARDLFQALWIPDIFMKRVKKALTSDGEVNWSLMCPDRHPDLLDTYGEDFEKRYLEYESRGEYVEQINILTVWKAILSSQKETGTPYMLYKDSVNAKNNQSNLGVIRNSNLCAEIVQWSGVNSKGEEEQAVCNLASIVLNRFVVPEGEEGEEGGSVKFDFKRLGEVVFTALLNLDRIIDINYYPTRATRRSNKRNRPVGLGVQGLADTYIQLGYPFESEEAHRLNRQIFETIYYHCLRASHYLATRRRELIQTNREKFNEEGEFQIEDQIFTGGTDWYNQATYSTWLGSPLSEGKFQFDLWGEKPDESLALPWERLRESITAEGVRNSLTTAVMPTATTAQILGNNECIEPYTYNLYTRRVLSGEFTLVNPHLQRALEKRGLWTDKIQNKLIRDRGSVQNIEEIPDELKELFKTSFEIKQKALINQARDRAPFIDQTQSLNLFFSSPTSKLLSSAHLYGWQCGLKTGMYYCRREQTTNALQFTVRQEEEDAGCKECSA